MDVTPPEGLDLMAVKAPARPEKVEYPTKQKKFRHYGHNVNTLIAKAIKMAVSKTENYSIPSTKGTL